LIIYSKLFLSLPGTTSAFTSNTNTRSPESFPELIPKNPKFQPSTSWYDIVFINRHCLCRAIMPVIAKIISSHGKRFLSQHFPNLFEMKNKVEYRV